VLLGVLPSDRTTWQFVSRKRDDQFRILEEGVATLEGKGIQSMPTSQCMIKMLLLEQGHHHSKLKIVLSDINQSYYH
jgi:hypothetical protein